MLWIEDSIRMQNTSFHNRAETDVQNKNGLSFVIGTPPSNAVYTIKCGQSLERHKTRSTDKLDNKSVLQQHKR